MWHEADVAPGDTEFDTLLYRDTVSKSGHMHRCQGLGLRHIWGREYFLTQCNLHLGKVDWQRPGWATEGSHS